MNKRSVSVLMMLVLVLGILVALAPATSAQQCPTTAPYPPVTGTLTVSETVVEPGDTITVSGSGYAPNSSVTVTMEREGGGTPTPLGTFTTNSSGSFSGDVEIPETTAVGRYVMRASGSDGQCIGVARVLSAGFTVRAAAAAAAVGPRTGTDVLPWLILAVAVIAVGGALVLVGRRRRGSVEQ